MPLAAIKKMLTETIGADEATKVSESLEKFQKNVTEQAEAGVKARVDEAVKAEKIKLETTYLTKLEEATKVGDAKIKEELTKYEKQLAERVKTVLTAAVDNHGDRLARIAEATEAKRGSALLEEVEKLVTQGKKEITEGQKADPKEVDALKKEVTQLKEQVAQAKKDALENRARANVAEQTAKELKESLETSISVVVEEDTEKTKTKPVGEDVDDKDAAVITEDAKGAEKPSHSPEMARMRKLAGIAKK